VSPEVDVARDEEHAVTRLMIALIRAYQTLLSPVLPPSCRFTPSCSTYAIDAYRQHGFWHGTRLAVGRLLRCGPWTAGGFDPVPEDVGNTPHLHGSARDTSRHNASTRTATGSPSAVGAAGMAASPEARLHVFREGE
jgi:putative membrane protein insertion efficiency factor